MNESKTEGILWQQPEGCLPPPWGPRNSVEAVFTCRRRWTWHKHPLEYGWLVTMHPLRARYSMTHNLYRTELLSIPQWTEFCAHQINGSSKVFLLVVGNVLKYLFHRYRNAGKVMPICGFKLCTSLRFKMFNSMLVMQESLCFNTHIKANKHYA